MKLAVEHIKQSVRETEVKIQHAAAALANETRVVEARAAEVAALKVLLEDLRAALVRVQGPPELSVVPVEKKKRA